MALPSQPIRRIGTARITCALPYGPVETNGGQRTGTVRNLPPVHESWLPNEHNLYRPRHSTKQRIALACALVFFLAPAVASGLGAQAEEFENRPLREFPSPAEGWGFFDGLSGWATDHLSLRQSGVRAAYGISAGVFGDIPPFGQRSTRGPVGIDPRDAGAPHGEGMPAVQYPDIIRGDDGWLYLGADVANKCRPVMDLDAVFGALDRLRHVVEASGRRFAIVVAPDKITAVPEHLPPEFVGRDCSAELSRRFWGRLSQEFGGMDIRGQLAMAAHRVGRPLYGPDDSHWTYAGGLTMTYALAERLRPGITTSWAVTEGETQPWPADLPPLLGRSGERQLRTYKVAPDGHKDTARYVASDFRTPLRLEQTSADPGAEGVVDLRVSLIADSFSQFASPFLAAGFRDIVVVHHETVAESSAEEIARLFNDRDVIAIELAERNVAGGASPLLCPPVIDRLGEVLARNPK